MEIKAGHSTLKGVHDEVFLSGIAYLTNACDGVENLHISIYSLTEQRFLYNNAGLKKMMADQSDKLLAQGWNYWYALIGEDERPSVKRSLKELFSSSNFQNPFFIKYHILNEKGATIYLRHEILRHCLGKQKLAINYFYDITEKEKLEAYLQHINTNSEPVNRPAQISPREREVLKLVGEGYSSKQIADQLFISNHTAISHRKNLIEKFNVKNTAQLIKRASRTLELW